ncbi:CsbD family protein [Corynebacterium sp. ES2794-CONJ1]|uniref:CsbD family protein n=1 Tax=unclassified Corynebacterium TaxID=2624378 RepID=UPI00216894EB|nr:MULTISPECIES: CsbD family protein [unclassified Corynebacterium]MCS4490365.1 CsbD family protein [Corynebacterium sp. ES2775-CONJ]MCS4492143.1 CsbD family protein [Corynebacterium sp. ES2715-CONJ3]MCS4532373.1 CsbD family protein [Corynebacterium sp. ES2730-CONJ]MCU9519664.1 CsbD family protein [Corynebacterium sp. ES2794-CONJ1]
MSDFDNTVDDLKGKAKEAAGDLTDNESLKDEGKADQVVADVKDAVHNAGDKVKEVADKVIGSFKKDDEK